MKPLVIYHGGCRDGFCAAWVVSRAIPDAEFHAGYYGTEPPPVAGRDVVIVDFSYPRVLMNGMSMVASSLLVLDHHKTAQADLASAPYATFDMNRSGAGMAWDHFFPGQPRPWLVDYVEDRDLWRWKLPGSREKNAYISVLPFDFAAWSAAHEDGAMEAGGAVLAKTDQYVREVAKNSRPFMFEGHLVPLVNAPQVDISELLDHVVTTQNARFAMGWWQRADGVFQYSLRSRGDFDVSELAKRHGGGGHKNAAGFQSSVLL